MARCPVQQSFINAGIILASAITVRGILDAIAGILGNARLVYPALERAPELRRWAGLRPGTPDGRPIIGRDPNVDGLWYATGHGRNGILLAAVTGDLVAAVLSGDAVESDLTAVSPARFWSE